MDRNSVLEMIWEDTPALTSKQLELLNYNRDRAIRLRLARRKKSEAIERHNRMLELEDMSDHLKDVLMTRLFDMLDEETTITFLDSKLLSAKAAIRVMASENVGSLVSTGSITSRRMNISWSLNIHIESIEERRTAISKIAMEWLREVVCEMVAIRSMEKLPTPDSVRRLGQVEVEMEQLSLCMPDVRDDDGAMDVTDLPETIATTSTPDGSGEMADVPDSMPDASARSKRKRNNYPVKCKRRRIVNSSEDNYYLNSEYHPTWRKYPLNK